MTTSAAAHLTYLSLLSDTLDAHTVLPHRSMLLDPPPPEGDEEFEAIIRCRCNSRSLADTPVVPRIIPASWFLTVLPFDAWIIDVPVVDRLAMAALPCNKLSNNQHHTKCIRMKLQNAQYIHNLNITYSTYIYPLIHSRTCNSLYTQSRQHTGPAHVTMWLI